MVCLGGQDGVIYGKLLIEHLMNGHLLIVCMLIDDRLMVSHLLISGKLLTVP